MVRRKRYGVIALAIGALVLGAVIFQLVQQGGFSRATSSASQSESSGGNSTADGGPVAAGEFRFSPPVSSADEIAAVRFTDAEGQETSFANFQGKAVLLNIWATWCAPCRKEMPTLDRLQKRLGGADFHVVALSIDHEGIAVVRDFYAELGLESLEIYVDEEARAPLLLNVLGVPTTLLIDAEGREIGRYIGPAEWDDDPVLAAIGEHLPRPAGTGVGD